MLKWFGPNEGEAKSAYRRFVKKGPDQGRRPDLVGGGLIRSKEGWSAVKALRRLRQLLKRFIGRTTISLIGQGCPQGSAKVYKDILKIFEYSFF